MGRVVSKDAAHERAWLLFLFEVDHAFQIAWSRSCRRQYIQLLFAWMKRRFKHALVPGKGFEE